MKSRVAQLLRRGSHSITSRLRSSRLWHLDLPGPDPCRPRIVVLSASVGSGHLRAAAAIRSALAERLPNATIAHVDVLELTNPLFRRVYSDGYFRAVERVPRLIGMMYDLLDHPPDRRASTLTRLAIERLNFGRLLRFLARQQWDLAINTHFLPAAIIGWLRRTGRAQIPQATVVTDFDVHGVWITNPCERYFVATEEARANVIGAGVDAGSVDVSGIPIDQAFAIARNRRQCRETLGLRSDRPVVLQLAGGFGVGSIQRIFRSLCAIQTPIQIVVVAGKNTQAREHLESLAVPDRHVSRVLGYTKQMHDLMAAADIVVSKPGGLTTSESLASGCAMVIVEPIPGQEDRNSDFLLENGCAIKVNNLLGLTHKVGKLLADPPRLRRMRQAALRCARPDAASRVAESCVRLVQRAHSSSASLPLAHTGLLPACH